LEKSFLKNQKSDFLFKSEFFNLNQMFLIFKFAFSCRFYQVFETGLCAQSHTSTQHGCHNSAISIYTLAEQKVSKQQLIKVSLPWLYM